MQVLALAAALALAGRAAAIEAPAEPAQPANTRVQQRSPVPSVEQIIERNAEARGGLNAWRAVSSISELGHLETGMISDPTGRHQDKRHTGLAPRETQVPFTMHMKRPHKFQLQIEYQGATAIQTFDGALGWTILPSPKGPVAVPFPPSEAHAAAMQQDLDGPLIDSVAKGIRVDFEGTETVDGRDAYRLMLTLRDGQMRRLWVDAKTFLDTKIDGTRFIAGKAWPVETYFSDYKKIHGLSIPHALDTAVVGARSLERIVIDRVVLNPALGDSIFAPSLPAQSP
jgi:hypothetical protein